MEPWSFERVLRTHAYLTAEFIGVWSTENYRNVTLELWLSLAQNEIYTSTWVMGVGGLVMKFFGRLQDYVLCDAILLMTLSLYQAMSNCSITINEHLQLKASSADIWNQYMKLLAQKINRLFGILLILIHASNGLMISHFILQSLYQEKRIGTLLLGVTVIKVFTIYYLATQVSDAVRTFKYLYKYHT